MIRPICKDILFLSKKAVPATKADIAVGLDLTDTLAAYSDRCVGMAANMIGINKAVIIISMEDHDLVMFNPVIVSKSGPYEAEEGCLSLSGERKAERFENIEVEYFDFAWKKQRIRLSGFEAEIAQHEIDHLNGKII